VPHSHKIDPRRNDRRVTDEQLPVGMTQREHHVAKRNEEGPRRDERAVPVFVEQGAGERGEEEGEEALGAVWVLVLVLPWGLGVVPCGPCEPVDGHLASRERERSRRLREMRSEREVEVHGE
jgi:hypothetical protein